MSEIGEVLNDSGLSEDRSLGFEKVMTRYIETPGPENGKGHLE